MGGHRVKLHKLITNVQQWSIDRGLDKADSKKQILKLYEEFGELASGLAKGNKEVIKDSIGDVVVVLIILAQQQEVVAIADLSYDDSVADIMLMASTLIGKLSYHISNNHQAFMFYSQIQIIMAALKLVAKNQELIFEDCLSKAWNEIKDRKGKLIDGVWVKEEDLK